MAIDVSEFTRRLLESGLLTEAELQAFVAGLPAGHQPADGEALARELVRYRKLTPFQAQQIDPGKGAELLLGQFLLVEKIGQGGMATVYKAEHRRMKWIAAVKVLSAAALKTSTAVERFRREVEAAARLTHPNIVAAQSAEEAGGRHFLVMEFVEGADLAAIVKKRGPLPVETAVDYLLQAAQGLEFAHAAGVVHRDVKPSNLMVDQNGVVKLLDLGLARIMDSDQDSTAAALTQSGAILGTGDYMSPEQADDTRTAGPAADIYSLGCTLHFLLIGVPVYGGASVLQKLQAHKESPIPSLRAARSDIPASLDAIFQTMVAKRPEDRQASMAQVVVALGAYRQSPGESAGSRPPLAPRLPASVPVFDWPQGVPQGVTPAALGGVGNPGGVSPVPTSPDSPVTSTASGGLDAGDAPTVAAVAPSRRARNGPRLEAPSKSPLAGWFFLLLVLGGMGGGAWYWKTYLAPRGPVRPLILEMRQPEIAGAEIRIDHVKIGTIATGDGEQTIDIPWDGKTHTLRVVKPNFITCTEALLPDRWPGETQATLFVWLDPKFDTGSGEARP
ncbi:MAG: protein kinase domain-containing protein [Planctomycetales bacterium]